MTTSDKITIIIGTVSLVGMCVTGWMGERLCDRILSRVQPKPTPEKNAPSISARTSTRKWYWVGMIEGITLLGLAWREPHKPITLTSVLDVSLGVSIILFSVLGYFIRCLLELIEDIARVGDKHIYFTGKIIETLAETAGDAEQEAHKS